MEIDQPGFVVETLGVQEPVCGQSRGDAIERRERCGRAIGRPRCLVLVFEIPNGDSAVRGANLSLDTGEKPQLVVAERAGVRAAWSRSPRPRHSAGLRFGRCFRERYWRASSRAMREAKEGRRPDSDFSRTRAKSNNRARGAFAGSRIDRRDAFGPPWPILAGRPRFRSIRSSPASRRHRRSCPWVRIRQYLCPAWVARSRIASTLESSMMRPVYLNRNQEIVISRSQACSSRSSCGLAVRSRPTIRAPGGHRSIVVPQVLDQHDLVAPHVAIADDVDDLIAVIDENLEHRLGSSCGHGYE